MTDNPHTDEPGIADDGDDETSTLKFVIGPEQSGQRLDKVLVGLCPEFSRSRLQALVNGGEVIVDGKPCTQSSLKMAEGQGIEVNIPAPVAATPQAQDIPLDIVYEDDDLLVINKAVGMVVHPGAGNYDGTLVNALLHHCGDSLSGIGGVIRPGIVHRLDRDTSGLLVVAKNDSAHRHLSEQLADRSLSRTYYALVWKVPLQIKGVIDRPIARHSTQRQKMTIPPQGGRDARTHYIRHNVFRDAVSFMQCDLETGRTHQIRVHMASIGHPLLGDTVYGLQKNAQASLLNRAGYEPDVRDEILSFPRQALHAAEIRFVHPATGEEMGFESPLPEDINRLISLLDQ